MELIIGGRAQGKLEFALAADERLPGDIAYCATEDYDLIFGKSVVYALHELVKRLLADGISPEEYILPQLKDSHIIICDEVGSGIVPEERGERTYRDAVGEICCAVAARADKVTRVICGIPVRIK